MNSRPPDTHLTWMFIAQNAIFFSIWCLNLGKFSILLKMSAFWTAQFMLCPMLWAAKLKSTPEAGNRVHVFFWPDSIRGKELKATAEQLSFIQGDLPWGRGPLCYIILEISLIGRGLCHSPSPVLIITLIVGFSWSPFNLPNTLLFFSWERVRLPKMGWGRCWNSKPENWILWEVGRLLVTNDWWNMTE